MGSHEEEILLQKEKAMKELAQGRDSVAKLATLLQISSSEKSTAEVLIEEIKGVINKAMASMEYWGYPSSCVSSSKESTGGKSKMQNMRKAGSRRRGSPCSWRRITLKATDDGRTWRKYGQKEIFGAKYPRSYFRCTYKFDQGCKASKQVQRSEDDPSSFVVTYLGEHTCVDPRKAMIPPSREPCIISFESSGGENVKQETPSSFPSVNQDGDEEVLSNLTSADSASNYFVSPDAEFRKPAQEETAAVIGQEHNGLPSALYSSLLNYGMELDCDDFFNFDF